jgi:Leucine-rich repeat (LRR) protein
LIYSLVSERKTIDLSNLNIHSIHNETFVGLSKLENLYLQNNSIRRIEFYSKDLQSLKFISLESNNIVQINKSILVGLNKIESVCLYNNPISNLFPTEMLKICETNPICKVYINKKC